MSVTDPGDGETLDAVYLGCGDFKSWSDMLGEVAGLLDADAMACCHDAALSVRDRVFTVSDDALPDETAYERMLHRADGWASPVTETDDHGHWLLLHDDTASTRAVFMLHRRGTPFTASESGRLMRIAPHLFRAIRLHARITEETSRAETALALLDLLETPVFLVDSRFTVVLSNAAARNLESRGAIKLNRRRLSFQCPETMKRAQQVVMNTGRGGGVSEQERLIRFEQPDGGSLLAVVEPLDGLFVGRDAAPNDAVAAIFFKDPERPVRSVEAVMREMHGMPPAEARLAAAIADGKTIKEYAVEAELSEGYVRDLSKRVMQRLGVRRQQQLVRAIIQTAPEISG